MDWHVGENYSNSIGEGYTHVGIKTYSSHVGKGLSSGQLEIYLAISSWIMHCNASSSIWITLSALGGFFWCLAERGWVIALFWWLGSSGGSCLLGFYMFC